MKIKLNKKNLQDIFRIGKDIINTTTLYQNAFITTQNNKISVIITDGELFIQSYCVADIIEEGSLQIPILKFAEIINTFGNDESINIDSNENNILLSTNKSIFKLKNLGNIDIPLFDNIDTDIVFNINQKQLVDMIKKVFYVTYHISIERSFLAGILFEKTGNCLRLITTSGHILAYSLYEDNSFEHIKDFREIIPSKTIRELLKILIEDNDCQLKVGYNKINISNDNFSITSSYIDYDYPKIDNIIPQLDTYFLCDKTSFLESLIRVSSLLSKPKNKININLQKNKMFIQAIDNNYGESNEEIDIEYIGNDIDIYINKDYIIQSLREIKSDKVIIYISDNIRPIVIKEEENNKSINTDSLAVIGLMRKD